MQFSLLPTFSLILPLLSSLAVADRAQNAKDALRIVAGNAHDKHAHYQDRAGRPGTSLHNTGRLLDKADKHKQINNNILSAVGSGGHAHRVHKRGEYDDGFELIGRDDTHEYFAREILEEPELFARGWEDDGLDFYY